MKKQTLVLKFGGSSVADPECIRRISGIAVKEADQYNVVVVVSAMGKTTDSLIKLASELSSRPQGRELDMLLATGELVSASLAAMCMQELGHPAVSMSGWQAGFITESKHNKARIAEVKADRIIEHLNHGEIVVVAGFQGCTEKGDVTTLGRGGSDTSAVALAAALNAVRCDIYTDVDGVYTTDPRIVPEARKLDYISYEEMIELASLGAKVLHLRSVELAKKYNVDLRVLSSFKGSYADTNTFEGKHRGTQVISLKRIQDMELTQAVTGVALDDKQAKVAILGVPDVPGIAAKIFLTLAERNISVDMIIQSVAQNNLNEIAFTVSKDSLRDAEAVCKEMLTELKAKEVVVDQNIAKVSVVGAGMLNKPGIASTMFKSLADASVNIQMISTSEIKISCMVSMTDAHRAVQAIHKAFELEKSNEPNYCINMELNVTDKALRDLNTQYIDKVLPHRYPFAMVDRVDEIVPMVSGRGYKNISINEPQFQGHFPGLPIMPGVLQIEAAAQLACMVVLADPRYLEGYLGVFTGMDEIKFRRMVTPGDKLDIEVTLTKFRYPFGKFDFTCKVAGELASSGNISFAMQKKADLTS